LTTIKTSVIIKFIESFPHKKQPPSTHGPLVYNIYGENGCQLNLRPILVMTKEKDYGDNGLKYIANSFGIPLQFLKKLLTGEKTKEDYELEVFGNKKV
jgi:hypothetical protein